MSNSDQTSERDWPILWRIAARCPENLGNAYGLETLPAGIPVDI